MAANGQTSGNVPGTGDAIEEMDGFRLGPAGDILMVQDAQAREKLAQLEGRVQELEARRQVWYGTQEQYNSENGQGKIAEGTILIFKELEEAGSGAGTEAQAAQEGGNA